jgi:hypothetical protein
VPRPRLAKLSSAATKTKGSKRHVKVASSQQRSCTGRGLAAPGSGRYRGVEEASMNVVREPAFMRRVNGWLALLDLDDSCLDFGV